MNDESTGMVLIIDDEPFEQSVLREMLDAGSYRIESAASGREAREIVTRQGESIHAILLDWILPDVDGLELLEWLQRQPSLADVEVVVQSAVLDSEAVERGIECGAYYYLTKPFEKAQLRAIVRAAIDLFELKRELAAKIVETDDLVSLLTTGVFTLSTIEQAELLAVHLASAAGSSQLGVALLELLVNSIEHGNLEIGYEEKSKLLASGSLKREIERRLCQEEYRNRMTEIRVTREQDHFDILIEDAGSGFDVQSYLTFDESRLLDSHGRGILIANTALEIQYFDPGNKVRVVLPISRPS